VRAIVCEGQGGPEVLAWREVPDPTPGPGQVLIAVAATAVNRADLLQRRGLYPPPPGVSELLGLEAAGTVLAPGPGAGGLRVGQRVMALLGGGGYAERVVAEAACVLPVPDAVGLPAAGGLMEVFLTAWMALRELGELRPGERVLIHGGAGGVGSAAIQLARALGARVWTTAGSPERLARCAELGAEGLIDHRREDFVARLREAGGADVILDLLGAAYLARNVEALAPDGRLVVVGLQGGVKGELPLLPLLQRRLRVTGFTLRGLPAARRAALVARFGAEGLPLFEAGRLRVVIDRVLPLTAAAEAHRALEGQGVQGKVILALGGDAAAPGGPGAATSV
jgi:putative PIG3 family NAD(P)H quinone oxidoreductase